TSQSSWSAICRKVRRSWVRRRTTSCCRTRPRSWFGVRQAMSPPWWEGTDFRRGGILGAAIRGYDDAPSTQVDGALVERWSVLSGGGARLLQQRCLDGPQCAAEVLQEGERRGRDLALELGRLAHGRRGAAAVELAQGPLTVGVAAVAHGLILSRSGRPCQQASYFQA